MTVMGHDPKPAPIEGWEQYRITPETPMRVFAGHETYCYMFPSRDDFTLAAIEAGLIPDLLEGIDVEDEV
jgi:hypothetical protein